MRYRQSALRVTGLVLILMGIAMPMAAQERPESVPLTVTEVIIDVTRGRTREWVIGDIVDLEPGAEFSSQAALDERLAEIRQRLLNERVLQEVSVVGVERSPGEVVVTIAIRDTWNVIVLPYLRYDSNDGLLLSLRARDYNLFGTMRPLEIDLDYERTETNQDLFVIASTFDIPVRLLDMRWRLILDQRLELAFNSWDFRLGLGTGFDFDWLGQRIAARYTQRYRYDSNDPLGDFNINTSRFALGSTISLPVVVPFFGPLGYTPELFAETNYNGVGMSAARAGLFVGFDHAVAAGTFDWIGNHRDGRRLRLGNTNVFNPVTNRWDVSVDARLSGYASLLRRESDGWGRLGLSGALRAQYYPAGAPSTQDDAAAPIRGVLDDAMKGDLGLYLNLDVSATFWTLRPLFEAQAGTFVDIAFVRDLRGAFYGSTAFDAARDLRVATGIEFIAFPLFARSLYLRGSFGFDVRRVLEGASPLDSEVREIFIGVGHHY